MAQLFYFLVPETGDKQDKFDLLSEMRLHTVPWQRLTPNKKHTWLVSETEAEFSAFVPLGSKTARREFDASPNTLFHAYSLGVNTNRDVYVYDFRHKALRERMKEFVQDYNVQVALYQQQSPQPNVDDFVDYGRVAWSSTLKQNLKRGRYASYRPQRIRRGLYRPFTKKYLFYDGVLVHRPGKYRQFNPTLKSEAENRFICVAGMGNRKRFGCLLTDLIPCIDLAFEKIQCFPFYTYDEDGGNRRENITDWARDQFRQHYADTDISKWDIFHYVYGLLHHPGYRERYAADLKRELPRVPFVPPPQNTPLSPPIAMGGGSTDGSKSLRPDSPLQCFGEGPGVGFRQFSIAGKALADLHLNYETAEKYRLRWSALKQPLDYKVVKMRPGKKRDAQDGDYKVFDSLRYNDTLLANDIPERAFAYRLGNRSALEWVIDQYRVKTDKRSGIRHDPNGYSDDEKYIVELIERVITVSLRTVEIVDELAKIPFRES